MLLTTITITTEHDPTLFADEALATFEKNHPGVKSPSRYLALVATKTPGEYDLHLVHSKRSRFYKRAVATRPYAPATENAREEFSTLLRARKITAEDLARVFGYSSGESLRKSPAYLRGEIQNTVLRLAHLLQASGK